MALAGGVCVMGSPGFFVEFSKQHALSDDGHCRPYSAHASGTVWAEGAAMFVLQRRSAALRDGRQVLAEVRASCLNQDGRTVGLTAPSGPAQARLFRRALEQAGVRPEDIGMIEGHGTGTRLGDRTELQSLAADLRRHRTRAVARCSGRSSPTSATPRPRPGALGLAKVLLAAEHARRARQPARRRGQPRNRLGQPGSTAGRPSSHRGPRSTGSGWPRCRHSV